MQNLLFALFGARENMAILVQNTWQKPTSSGYAMGNRCRPSWTSRSPDPEGRESATPFQGGSATSLLRETAHQPAICHFAKEIDARYVLRADRKKQYDRMDFK